MLGQEETAEMRAQIELAARERDGIQRRIDLRAAFLKGDMSARQLELRQMLHDARARLEAAEAIYNRISVELEEVREANAAGMVPMHEVKQVEYQMISARAERRIAELELTLIEEKLGE
jgi:hypothetical protein